MILTYFCQDLIHQYEKFRYLRLRHITPSQVEFYFPISQESSEVGRPLTDFVNMGCVCEFFYEQLYDSITIYFQNLPADPLCNCVLVAGHSWDI